MSFELLSYEIKKLFEKENYLENVKKEVKELNEQINEKKKKIIELMDTEDVTEITVNDIIVKRDVSTKFSIEGGDWNNEKFFDWLEEIGLEDVIKWRQTVDPEVRQKILEKYACEDELPHFIKDTYIDTIKYPLDEVIKK